MKRTGRFTLIEDFRILLLFSVILASIIFSARAAKADSLAPITVSSTTQNATVISWFTNQNSDSQVYFGISTSSLTEATGTTNLVRTSTSDASGLLGYWNFEEGTGTTAIDQSGNGNNGTWKNSGAPRYTTAAQIGSFAGNFIGGTSYVLLPAINTFNQHAFTVTGWIYFNGTGSNANYILFDDFASTSIDQELNLTWGSNKITFSFGGADKTQYSVTSTANTWYHLGFTWGGPGTTRYIYLNGTQVASGTPTGNLSIPDGTTSTYIGAVPRTSNFLQGKIDDAMVYNRALSAAEIQALYNNAFVYGHSVALTGLAPSTTYDYYLASTLGGQTRTDNNSSTYYSFTTTNYPPPTSFSATAGDGQAALTWGVPTSTGGSSITGYIVQDKLTASSTFATATTTGASATSAVITGLTAGVSYDFQVSAQLINGYTSLPATVTGVVPGAIPTITTSTPLSFSVTQGGAATSSSALVLANDKSSTTLNWAATSTQSWLSFQPSSGSLAANASTSVQLTVDPTGFSPGIYVATGTIWGCPLE
jgi:hypothetical protein